MWRVLYYYYCLSRISYKHLNLVYSIIYVIFSLTTYNLDQLTQIDNK